MSFYVQKSYTLHLNLHITINDEYQVKADHLCQHSAKLRQPGNTALNWHAVLTLILLTWRIG